ncbi:MAG TPA: MarR family transcriptional regulator [Actinocrinis sp.]|nr:MarR family transcriptional regulator [Actinocrinis sp.]
MEPLPPSLLDLTAYLLSKVGKAARRRAGDLLAARGLRLWHMAVLAALDDFGPQIQRDLGARLGIDPSDMVKVLDELAGADLVERTRDPADRRRVLVAATGAGRQLLAELQAEQRAADDELLAPLAESERAQLHAVLLRLHTHTAADGKDSV